MNLEHEKLSGQIIGDKELGLRCVESISENDLAIELRHRGMRFHRKLSAPVLYKGVEVGLHRLDHLVANEILVELKTVRDLTDTHFAFVRSYLPAVARQHGLILNSSNRPSRPNASERGAQTDS